MFNFDNFRWLPFVVAGVIVLVIVFKIRSIIRRKRFEKNFDKYLSDSNRNNRF